MLTIVRCKLLNTVYIYAVQNKYVSKTYVLHESFLIFFALKFSNALHACILLIFGNFIGVYLVYFHLHFREMNTIQWSNNDSLYIELKYFDRSVLLIKALIN